MGLKTDTSAAIERWIRLANLLSPDAPLVAPELVQESWELRPPKVKVLKRIWSRHRANEIEPYDADPQSTKLLRRVWRAWEVQFSGPAQDLPLSPSEFPRTIPKSMAKKILRKFAERQRAEPIPLEVIFLVERERGRPRKNGQSGSGLVTQTKGWIPDDEMQLYRVFYAVRTTLEKIARSDDGALKVLDVPMSAAIFITSKGTSISRGPVDQFLRDLLRVGFSRIRECPIDARLYYAWRDDLGACSPRCRDLNNTRNSRSSAKRREYEKNRNENRRAEAARKKKLAFTRSKGDGQ
jgi:hypothetical protein